MVPGEITAKHVAAVLDTAGQKESTYLLIAEVLMSWGVCCIFILSKVP